MEDKLSDEEKDKILEEFLREVQKTIDKFDQIPKLPKAACLIKLASIDVCSSGEDYYRSLGYLIEILTTGFSDLWDLHNKEEEEQKEE